MLLRCSARQPRMRLVALLESSCEAGCAHQYVPGAVKGTVACPLLVGAEICFRGGASVKTCSQGSGCELVHCTHGRKGVQSAACARKVGLGSLYNIGLYWLRLSESNQRMPEPAWQAAGACLRAGAVGDLEEAVQALEDKHGRVSHLQAG